MLSLELGSIEQNIHLHFSRLGNMLDFFAIFPAYSVKSWKAKIISLKKIEKDKKINFEWD